MISARSLRVDYDDVTAVLDLDLEIAAGQIYGLVGPNGAGKTSTIKALGGLVEPTYGEVTLSGVDMELEPRRAWRRLGYMPDFAPVYENLKVREYLDAFAAAHLIPRAERSSRIVQWTKRVGIESKMNAFVRELSRGMRQRLVLAKTMLHDPKILLLDEPASGMDPVARVELRKILKEAAGDGAAVLISSHILTELSDFCSAIGIMEKGRMVASGTVEEIREQIGSMGVLTVRLPAAADAGARARVEKALGESGLVKGLKEGPPGTFAGQFTGEDAGAAELLGKLARAGVAVADFHVEKEDIEAIFLRIGAKEVS